MRLAYRSPSKAQAASAVAVIVDYDFVVELLALHAKSILPVGAMTDDDSDYCVH
jgi:hypothetical protein